jgi:hypothetical protein
MGNHMAWFIKSALLLLVVAAAAGSLATETFFQVKLMSAIATAVIVALDYTKYRWVGFLSVLIWLFFLSSILTGLDSSLAFGFLSFQWIFIMAALTCAPYRGWITMALSFLLACGIIAVVAVGSENLISDKRIVFFGVAIGLMSACPLLIPSTAAHSRGAIFHFLGLQQTILRVAGIMMFYSFKPVLIDFDLAYALNPLFMSLAGFVLIMGLYLRSADFWDRAVQTILSLLVLSESLWQTNQAQWPLLALTFLSYVYSMTSRGTDRGLSLFERSIRPLENCGFGSALFVVSTYLVYLNRKEATTLPYVFWMSVVLLMSMASWYKTAWPVILKTELRTPRLWLVGKLALESAVVLAVLFLGGYHG